ncbi:uncharacterized protein LOC131293410 [Anopheles ziemanni]|uniref:uncharacterized protein LOC131264227 n=1 Tax=Anopheles coustani TaxID=139045 RepID=UPI00265B1B1F|nr:uncharacterized protein LOC131264227 [Anopheles coustani]XP_058177471.1 uncharacterized protein LOC131293410 [Anopheles ziemanni]
MELSSRLLSLVFTVGFLSSITLPTDASFAPLTLDGWPYSFPLGPWHDLSQASRFAPPVPIIPVVAGSLAEYPGAIAVMATRGSIHIAPLPGHSVSQFHYNLDAPPGTY